MAKLETAVRNAACNAITTLIDADSLVGKAKFEASSDTEIATCAFSAIAFGTATNGMCTAASITDDSSATGGTIEHVSFYSGGGTKIMECSIAVGATKDFQISNLQISAGDTVGISTLTVTVPAGTMTP